MSYKRNRIEEAIARIFDPNCKQPPSELRARIKRLLELDRPMGRKAVLIWALQGGRSESCKAQ